MNGPAPTVEQTIVACLEKVLMAFGRSATLNFIGPEWFYTDDDQDVEPPPCDADSINTPHTGTAP